jgi:diaminopimelate epimerase
MLFDNLPFAKFQGAGNDFVVLDGRPGTPAAGVEWTKLAVQLCDRHYGVGADGILVAAAPSAEACAAGAAFRMRMYNPDGTESEMCGNGLRCFARWLADAGELAGATLVETGAGVLRAEPLPDGSVRCAMGAPRLAPRDVPLSREAAEGRPPDVPVTDLLLHLDDHATLLATCVSMGNPHAVIFVGDVERVPLEELGPQVERHPHFPARTNVEFVQVLAPDRLRVRVWERGAGATLACGTGACAALVAARLNGYAGKRAALELPGGILDVSWAGAPGDGQPVLLSGPAVRVFDGAWRWPEHA